MMRRTQSLDTLLFSFGAELANDDLDGHAKTSRETSCKSRSRWRRKIRAKSAIASGHVFKAKVSRYISYIRKNLVKVQAADRTRSTVVYACPATKTVRKVASPQAAVFSLYHVQHSSF